MPFERAPSGPQVGLGGHITPAIKGLLVVNVAAFLIQYAFYRMAGARYDPVALWFGLDPKMVIGELRLWQPFTYMFLHSPEWLGHLLLNMLMLWMFGTEVERRLGLRGFLRYYVVCGIGAAIVTGLVFPDSATIGASGAVFGVMLAYALLFPGRTIYFWFIFPMRAMSFVLLCAGIELFSLLGLRDGIAHTAHLGGMLFGYLYLKRAWRVRGVFDGIRWRFRRRRFRVMPGDDDRYPYH